VRVVVDHTLQDQSSDRTLLKAQVEPGQVSAIAAAGPLRDKYLPAMLEKSRSIAAVKSAAVVAAARRSAAVKLGAEVARLTALGEINDHIQAGELDALRAHESAVTAAINSAQLRLDAVRLVRRL
jgi:ATP-dependent helicase HepA